MNHVGLHTIKIGDLGKIVTGKTPSTKQADFWDGDIPFVTPVDLQKGKRILGTERTVTENGANAVRGALLPPKSICVSCIGNLGYTALTTCESVSNQQINSIVPSKDYDADFVYYLMKSLWSVFKSLEGQSTTLSILNKTLFSKIEITVPDLETQKRIARILSSLDDKIEVNNQINRNLEEQAKAIFKSWFVDFEPFGGKQPDDWETISFSSFLKPRREKSSDPSIPLFAVTNNGIIPRDEKFKKNLSRTGAQNKVAYRTDMLFGMSREILNWGIMQEEKGCISSAYHVFAVSDDIDSQYLELYIKANIGYFKDLIRPAAREGQGLDQQALMSKEILLPPEDIISAYHNIADPTFVKIQQINTENKTLSTLRDTLLPKLMSGEIEI